MPDDGIKRDAIFSDDRVYRYTLRRVWDEDGPHLLWILLNPSTADKIKDDPTNVRGINFAKRWGFGGLTFCNLFAWRTPSPKVMKKAAEPIGPHNDEWIQHEADAAHTIALGWGTHGPHRRRDRAVLRLLGEYTLHCLVKTKDGHPKHPLYARGDLSLQIFREAIE